MGYTVSHNYSDDFINLMNSLKTKYGEKLFDLDGIGKQLDFNNFRETFFGAQVAADASIDPNANVEDVSPITYGAEFGKASERLDSYYVLYTELLNMTSKKEADEIIERQLVGDIYINDFHGITSRKPYCFNYATFDVLSMGLPMVAKVVSLPPKHLLAFRSQLEQFITIASNSTLGATGMADLLISMSYYMKNILATKSDAHFHFVSEEDCWEYFKQTLVSFIYTVNQPMRANQCFDDTTEILTLDGWKRYDELSLGQQVYTWHDGNLNVQPITHLNIQHYTGEMHHYHGRGGLDFLVTPNHRILKKKNNKLGDAGDDYEVKYSSEVILEKTVPTIPITVLDNDRPDYPIEDYMLQAITIFLTDGCIKSRTDPTCRNSIEIYKSPKRWGGDFIRQVLSQVGEFKVKEQKSTWGTVEKFSLGVDASQRIFDYAPVKTDLPECFKYLSKRQARIVIDVWSKFDDHIEISEKSRKIRCRCDNYLIADKLQHVAMLAGYGSKIEEREFNDTSLTNNRKPTLYLRIFENKTRSLIEREIVQYDGTIWCPTVDDGLIVVRRNGVTFISGNSPFTNISLYDRPFLENLIADIIFPDGSRPDADLICKMQEIFVDTMNEEMRRSPITFPVTTACFSVVDNEIQDRDFLKFISEKNLEFGFINIYMGDSSTLSSCCRLRSSTKNEFFNSFGAGSSKIGSLGVVTINFPRLAYLSKSTEEFEDNLRHLVRITGLINQAKRNIIQFAIDAGKEPLYNLGFMELNKQYSTTGVNGLYECLEFLDKSILTEEGQEYAIHLMRLLNEEIDKMQSEYRTPHNVEQIPGESASVKMARKDKYLGYDMDLDLYSNQFIPLTSDVSMLDRVIIQGKLDSFMSGGSVLHLNVTERLQSNKDIEDLIEFCAKSGVVYFAVNYLLNRCVNGHMSVGVVKKCPVCGEEIEGKYTRVVGFLTKVNNWNKVRREKDFPNRVFYNTLNFNKTDQYKVSVPGGI